MKSRKIIILVGVWLLFLEVPASGCAKLSVVETERLEREMEREVRLAVVQSITPVDGGPTSILTTDNNIRLKVTDPDLLTRVTESYEQRELVILFYDRQSMVAIDVFPPPSDLLIRLTPESPTSEQIIVHLLMRPSLYYLPKTEPRFHELYSLLERAKNEGRAVAIAVFPGGNKVHDVRIMPP